MLETVIDLTGNVLKVKRVDQTEPGGAGGIPASSVTVSADVDLEITAGDLQATLEALATRIQSLENEGN